MSLQNGRNERANGDIKFMPKVADGVDHLLANAIRSREGQDLIRRHGLDGLPPEGNGHNEQTGP